MIECYFLFCQIVSYFKVHTFIKAIIKLEILEEKISSILSYWHDCEFVQVSEILRLD